jgi:C-terminal processing protease CtpA/Prc
MSSCEKLLIESDPSNTYATNFELFWSDFDQNYPLFIVKKINWDSTYQKSTQEIKSLNNDEDFFNFLSKIILNFEDAHVNLRTNYGDVRFIHSNSVTENSPTQIQNYVSNLKDINKAIDYGDIDGTELGYIRIKTFGSFLPISNFEVIDEILIQFENKKGIVLDIRSNGGGSSTNAITVSSKFINESSCFMKYRYRNGPKHNDLTDGINLSIQPKGTVFYTKPIAILTNRTTVSASEYFTQSLKDYSHVTIVGDTTSGAIGIPIWRELPIGWTYRIPINLAETCNGISYEHIGIPPDFPIWISQEDSNNGVDTILEIAISVLNRDINEINGLFFNI